MNHSWGRILGLGRRPVSCSRICKTPEVALRRVDTFGVLKSYSSACKDKSQKSHNDVYISTPLCPPPGFEYRPLGKKPDECPGLVKACKESEDKKGKCDKKGEKKGEKCPWDTEGKKCGAKEEKSCGKKKEKCDEKSEGKEAEKNEGKKDDMKCEGKEEEKHKGKKDDKKSEGKEEEKNKGKKDDLKCEGKEEEKHKGKKDNKKSDGKEQEKNKGKKDDLKCEGKEEDKNKGKKNDKKSEGKENENKTVKSEGKKEDKKCDEKKEEKKCKPEEPDPCNSAAKGSGVCDTAKKPPCPPGDKKESKKVESDKRIIKSEDEVPKCDDAKKSDKKAKKKVEEKKRCGASMPEADKGPPCSPLPWPLNMVFKKRAPASDKKNKKGKCETPKDDKDKSGDEKKLDKSCDSGDKTCSSLPTPLDILAEKKKQKKAEKKSLEKEKPLCADQKKDKKKNNKAEDKTKDKSKKTKFVLSNELVKPPILVQTLKNSLLTPLSFFQLDFRSLHRSALRNIPQPVCPRKKPVPCKPMGLSKESEEKAAELRAKSVARRRQMCCDYFQKLHCFPDNPPVLPREGWIKKKNRPIPLVRSPEEMKKSANKSFESESLPPRKLRC